MNVGYDKVVKVAKAGSRFLVVSHVNPEGDAIGSLLGLALALKKMGKDATPYIEDAVPDIFKFMPGAGDIKRSLEGCGPFDATFAVDCGQKDRLGRDFNARKDTGTLVNIDHHATNDNFGEINVIDQHAGACGELVFDLCKALGVEIDKDIATNLYVAIHTDTGSFRYSSATPQSFEKAGELVRRGADPWEISRKVYENYPARKYRLLAMVLSTLDVIDMGDDTGNIATLVVTRDMFSKAGAEKDLSDGFVNYARGIEGVEVGILLRESGPGEYKVSLRSKGRVDVAEAAKTFGGGGHRNAAGFALKGGLDEIKARVVAAIKGRMAERAV